MMNAAPPSAEPTALAVVGPLPSAVPRRRLVLLLAALLVLGGLAGLATGSQGLSLRGLWADLQGPDAQLLIGQIRAPRALGAALVGALLGLCGALAQGIFRNPLADPFLLGSAAGAGLGVVAVLAGTAVAGASLSLAVLDWLARLGLVGGAFLGSLAGVTLTLLLARGAAHTLRLLLAGVVVGVMLGAVSDFITMAAPEALRAKQAFLLGSTAYLGWPACALLGLGLLAVGAGVWRLSRALDALTLGEDSAASLGLDLVRLRLALVLLLSLGTALAVAQAGLVAFVGLMAPHLVRRAAPGPHGWLLLASAGMGAALLLWSDVIARLLMSPQELPVGLVTGVVGGVYLVWLLKQRSSA